MDRSTAPGAGNGAPGEHLVGAPVMSQHDRGQLGLGQHGLERAREEHLHQLLARFEAGALDAYEYARRARIVEQAPSEAAMAEVCGAPAPAEPVLDPVDLALLARSISSAPSGSRRGRAVWWAVLGAFFVVLLVVGMWLVSHTRSLQQSGNLGAAAGLSLAVDGAGFGPA